MDLTLVFKELKQTALQLGDYTQIPINDLADKYCTAVDTGDEQNKNIYFSALVMRFWYKISKMYNENKTLNLDYIDYYDGLIDAIQQACAPTARAWQTNHKLNAQQVINQILSTRFIAQKYYESNLKKNAGKNFTVSLEDKLSTDEDSNILSDIIKDTSAIQYQDNSEIYRLIQGYINADKLIEAIIIDNIAFKDVLKQEKEIVKCTTNEGKEQKYTKYYNSFWPFKLIRELSSLDSEYKNYFINTYEVATPALEAAFKAISKANTQKKHKYLNATIRALRFDYDCLESRL